MGHRRFLFLLASAREHGNTEIMARHAAAHLPSGTEQRWLRLADHPLPEFEDVRHTGDGVYPVPEGNARTLLEATVDATDIVIASPLYWYSLATSAKHYMDHWAGWMRVPGFDFRARMRDKTVWGVCAVSDEDFSKADPLIGSLRLSAEYFGARFGGVLLGYANRPGEVLQDTEALERARTFFSEPHAGGRPPGGGRPQSGIRPQAFTRLASPNRTRIVHS
jgi:hypothetical protein